MSATRETWTVRQVTAAARELLGRAGIESARLDADLLLGHALGLERIQLYAHQDRPLSPEERAAYRELIRARARRRPLAYLTGRKSFFTHDLEVGEGVLVPRPETEHLVERVLDELRGLAPSAERPVVIADVGTGSGAIAVTVAKLAGPHVEVHATDLSEAALAVARRNAERHGVAERVSFHHGDLDAPLRAAGLAGQLAVLASNPPYVAERDRAKLAPELLHEPELALFAGEDGLACLDRLIPAAPALLRPGGLLVCEIGWDQGGAVRERARAAGLSEVEVLPDLEGRDRVLCARRPGAR